MIDAAFQGNRVASRLDAARNGCPVAFEDTVGRHTGFLLAIARDSLSTDIATKTDAADLVQDLVTFGFDGDGGEFLIVIPGIGLDLFDGTGNRGYHRRSGLIIPGQALACCDTGADLDGL